MQACAASLPLKANYNLACSLPPFLAPSTPPAPLAPSAAAPSHMGERLHAGRCGVVRVACEFGEGGEQAPASNLNVALALDSSHLRMHCSVELPKGATGQAMSSTT
jgi:hypothetical protein